MRLIAILTFLAWQSKGRSKLEEQHLMFQAACNPKSIDATIRISPLLITRA